MMADYTTAATFAIVWFFTFVSVQSGVLQQSQQAEGISSDAMNLDDVARAGRPVAKLSNQGEPTSLSKRNVQGQARPLTIITRLPSINTTAIPAAQLKYTRASQNCLTCIRSSLSGSKANVGCIGNVCGPYQLSLNYWAASGRLRVAADVNKPRNDFIDFPKCANDVSCATKVVKTYLEKYGHDCNGDGLVNCDDYARIQRLGVYGCSLPADIIYESSYYSCRGLFLTDEVPAADRSYLLY